MRNNVYQAGLSTYLTTGSQAPFWLHSNQYGEVPFEGNVIQGMISVHHEYDSTYSADQKLNRWAMGYGLRAVGNLGRVNDLRLTEAYLKGRAGPFEFYAGRRREIVGLVDTTLSSGSYIWSGNALPLPKVQLSIPNYTPILKNKLLSIKGTFAHGWFGSTDSVQNYYLHQKTFYARLGKPQWRIKFYAGFNHQVQWGGKPTVPFYDAKSDQIITSYPSDFASYIKVVSGVSLNKNLDVGEVKDGIPFIEAFNRAGNHLGTIDLGMDIKTSIGTFLIFRQSIFEDGSLFYLNNITDGLTGISIKNNIWGASFELLDTRNQGGSNNTGGPAGTIDELRGLDNYFNNGLYKDGYTYQSLNIGTPFIIPLHIYQSVLEVNDSYNRSYLLFNRLKSRSFSFYFLLKHNISFRGRFSDVQVVGHYDYPISENLKNLSLLLQKSNKRWVYEFSTAFDISDYFGDRLGLKVSVQRFFLY